MYTVLAVISTVAVWAFIQAHQLIIFWFLAAAIDQLPAPDNQSGKFYRWFFGVVQFAAANLIRSKRGVQGTLGNGGKVS